MAGEENDAEVSRKLYDMVINSDETSRRGVCISKEKMLERIAKSDAVVKSQQRDEPDLTDEKRYEILDEILTKKPATFLYRFGTFVSEEDLGYFNNLEDDYEIKFYLKEIKKQLNSKEHKRKVRNRRYECMKKLKSDTDYFGDREMRKRCPLLFEQYVGQFMTDEEYHKMDSNCDETFSGFLFSCIDKARLSEKFEHEKEQEECMEEEEETDSDEDDVEKHEKINSSGINFCESKFRVCVSVNVLCND